MAVTKRDLSYQVGIFKMYINNHSIIVNDENYSFMFEHSLLQAAKDGLINDVELLLQLGAHINYQCKEGGAKTNETDKVVSTQSTK